MGRVDGHARCVCASDDEPCIACALALGLLTMGLSVVQHAENPKIAQHQGEVRPGMDAVDVVNPGLALAPYIASADDAAVSVPDQGEAA